MNIKKLQAALLAWGIPGLFIFAVLDGAGLPLPGGLDLALIWLANAMPDRLVQLVAVGVVGSTLGNLILFTIARKGGELYLSRHTESAYAKRFHSWYLRYGLLMVFIVALVPLPGMPTKIFVVCAGALGSTVRSFVSVFGTARLIRYAALAYLGAELGEDAIAYVRGHWMLLFAIAVGLFVVLYGMIRFSDRQRLKLEGRGEPARSPGIES